MNSSTGSRISLLTRHRWIPLLDARAPRFTCHPRVPPLYDSYDPVCYGCESTIVFTDLRGYPDQFRPSIDERTGETANTDAKLEELGVRLDLRFCELALEQEHERRWGAA